MDIGYFRIDFQVNHQFRHTHTGPIIFVFKDTLGKWSRKEYHAFDISFSQRIPRFCRTVLALGIPCKARGAQEYDAPNGGSLDEDSANNGARRHPRSIGRAFGVDADPARRRSAKAVAGRFQVCESMISFLPGRSACAQERARPVQSNSGPSSLSIAPTRARSRPRPVGPHRTGEPSKALLRHGFLDGMARTTTDETTPALVARGVFAMNLIAGRIHIGGSPCPM